jgi:hypothetical protein
MLALPTVTATLSVRAGIEQVKQRRDVTRLVLLLSLLLPLLLCEVVDTENITLERCRV